ncbi:hypothetical protein OIU79_018413 [Salix purpurea]|uniref:Uncharacterized protein n=1 Tax=Salix purpurea TaxID=77065 RepID=A0A9Q0WYP2_SALPP|nr:hypothetical protein OIU79_018413 [Salix purpurea]
MSSFPLSITAVDRSKSSTGLSALSFKRILPFSASSLSNLSCFSAMNCLVLWIFNSTSRSLWSSTSDMFLQDLDSGNLQVCWLYLQCAQL